MKSFRFLFPVVAVALLTACSATKFVPDNSYLLEKVELKSDTKDFDVTGLEPYIRQKANSRWFSIFKIPLGTYSLSGRDSTKWVNRTLQKIGEKPVVYDTVQARLSCADLKLAMQNMGYMHASVDLHTKAKGKKIKAVYTLHPGEPYHIHSVRYRIDDRQIDSLLQLDKPENQGLHAGDRFTTDRLDAERDRVARLLLDRGYFRFHKDFIRYEADSASNSNDINICFHLLPYVSSAEKEAGPHPRYLIRNINYQSTDSAGMFLRRSILLDNTSLQPGHVFSASALQNTYNNFARLQAVRFTNISFREVPDSGLLDCDIQLTPVKPNTLIFQPEGTNTAGDLGAAVSLTWQNRNLFRGSELFSVELRGAFEAITGLEGYSNQDYQEYGVSTKLTIARFLAPFLSRSFRRQPGASTEFSVSWNLQNRPEFHRRVFSTAMRYRWSEPGHHLAYRFDLLDLNYVYMPWISATFKHDYLDSVSNRNAILRYNYDNLFIMKIGFGLRYSNGSNSFRANVEMAGNVLNGVSHLLGQGKNGNGQYTLFNIAYAQYMKFDFDYTHIFQFDADNSLALHTDFGIAWPYGNSTVLPFEKRYFSGGPNSVRGWGVRELGPGRFRGTDGRIDFINQTGDMKFDLNAEYRTKLFWKFNGAVFVDAGNIWTLRDYPEQPGGQFQLKNFLQEIAVAYGLGIRLNFDYFLVRFDMGMKAINPAYTSDEEHYAIFHPDFGRDFCFHFAVGLPF